VLLFVLGTEEPPAPTGIIRCNDDFVCLDKSEWRFQRRSLSVVAGKV
jgi:hypothetical protein